MKLFQNKKAIAVGLSVGLALGLTGVAAAYWTTGGTGSGSATTDTPTSNLTVNANVATALDLAGTAQAVDLSVINPNAYSVDLKGDTATINTGSITCQIGSATATSVPDSWFTLSSGAITNTSVTPAHQTTALAQTGHSGLTLTMNDVNADQDACQGATVAFTITVSSETGH
jgi:hypothetical protein